MPTINHHNINTFFALLRAGLYGVPVGGGELPDVIDWEAVVALARKHAVLGVIIESIRLLPEGLRPTGPMVDRMNKYALRLIKSNVGLDRKVAQLVLFFERHGIHGVLLKGQGIARSYRVPQMRQTGDIDFYVGESQYGRAVELCREHLIVADDCDCEESSQHFAFRWDGVMIELHRKATDIYSPYKRRRLHRWFTDELERSPRRRVMTVADTSVTLPSVDFNVVYIFYHSLRHLVEGGIGLRQLSDWAMVFYAHGDEIDAEQLRVNINRLGLTRGWKLFARIAVEYLGVPRDKMPLYDPNSSAKSEKLLEMILSGGNFGFHSQINATAPTSEFGFANGYALAKFRYISRYMAYTFPVMPLEATCFYIHRQLCVVRTVAKSLFK